MDYATIFEISQYLHDGIYFSDMRKKFIPESFALARSLYETCNIYEFYAGIDFLFGL
jgi:hypothetical protein